MEDRIDIQTTGDGLPNNYKDLLATINRNMDPNSNTVLLVDDERGIRLKVARDVKAFDSSIVVHEAGNGKEALDKLKEIRAKYFRDPLFIVLDLNMPIMDGWEVVKHLKKEYEEAGKPCGIPIIILSSTSGEKGVIFKSSVHDGKSGYQPLVSIAKETCTDKGRYDAAGAKGLMAWLKHFLKE
jgi:CheY-like chemotaxis protein